MDFKENDLFQENEQNEHISVKLQIPMDFQKTAFYRSGLNEQNEQFSVKSAVLSDMISCRLLGLIKQRSCTLCR